MDNLVVFNAPFNFVSYGTVVLFVKLLLKRIAKLLDALFNELGASAECCHVVVLELD
jgi:hypothetical protein